MSEGNETTSPPEATSVAAARAEPIRLNPLVYLRRVIASLTENFRSPIFTKEVFVSGRRKATYYTRAGYTLLLLGVVICTYLIFTFETSGSRGVGAIQQLQALAPTVTVVIGWFQFIALAFIAPVLTSPALCDERRSGTLGALFTTPLTAFQIVMGKLAGQSVQLLILALIATPVLLAIRVFGGVNAEIILGVSAVTLTTAMLGACLGMLFSIYSRRAVSAAGAAVLSLVATQGAGPMILALGAWKLGWPLRPDWFGMVSSPATMGLITAEVAGGGMLFRSFSTVWVSNSMYNLALAAIALTICIIGLRRAMLADAGGQRTVTPKRSKAAHAAASDAQTATEGHSVQVGAGETSQTQAPARRKVRQVVHKSVDRMGDNPVLWREWRIPVFRTSLQKWAVIGVVFLLYVLIHVFVDRDDHRIVHIPITGIASVLMVFLAAIGTTGGIASEHESRTLDSLLTTPLSAWEVVYGKFIGAVRRQWVIPFLLFTHLCVFGVFVGLLHPIVLFHAAIIIISTVAFLAGTGVWLGTRLRKTTTAAAWNFVVALSAWALPFLIAGLVFYPMLGHRVSEEFLSLFAAANPITMLMLVVTGFDDDLINWREPLRYRFFDFGTIGPVQMTAVVMVYGCFYCLLAFGAMRLAVGRLSVRTGRA